MHPKGIRTLDVSVRQAPHLNIADLDRRTVQPSGEVPIRNSCVVRFGVATDILRIDPIPFCWPLNIRLYQNCGPKLRGRFDFLLSGSGSDGTEKNEVRAVVLLAWSFSPGAAEAGESRIASGDDLTQ